MTKEERIQNILNHVAENRKNTEPVKLELLKVTDRKPRKSMEQLKAAMVTDQKFELIIDLELEDEHPNKDRDFVFIKDVVPAEK